MYVQSASEEPESISSSSVEQMLDFDAAPNDHPSPVFSQSVKSTPMNNSPSLVKIIDKEPRKVTEIRVYYDDQTYETFVPLKTK